ncbi:tyrosine-type recombinase/integrase [Hydrogenimonas cancrithermarum]|uniref:Tyr recombinase domain-containing protein n=1 Tax=Hydrogenimonas cancrithermarum TaxID=2993563 RepID=A0ABM8FN29_9BACT|nr:tyrosine-type recombinase/integrase [Hydrogenimonas cancrithermarum]BDY13783.1 hypothetical protein HCR_20950 [Hydrogenimonas cancrithermarum]
MEVGKYISLGNGIQVRKAKNDTYTYYHSYRDKTDNKVKRKKLFTTDKADAKGLKKAILMVDNLIETEQEAKDKITLNDLSKRYFESRRKKMIGELRRKYNNMDEETFLSLKNVKNKLTGLQSEVNRYNKNIAKSEIAEQDIETLKRQDFKAFLDNDLNLKGLSAKTVYNMVSLCKTIINYGIRNEIIEIQNPLTNFSVKNPKRKRLRYLNIEELEQLLKECQKHENPNVYMSVYLGVLTGARARSVLNIKKKDIDFKNNHIKLDNFKSNKIYTVAITKKASKWLEKQTKELKPDDYIIYNRKKPSNQPFTYIPKGVYQIMDELFNQNIDKKNNEERDNVVNFHTIRRSIATNMALEGVDIFKIMTFLNHGSTKQTHDYLNLSGINLNQDIEALHGKIFANF